MVQNYLVFECGHTEPEVPSVLKKVKRALSIKRVLSTKVLQPKDIPVNNPCEKCQREAKAAAFGKKAPYGERVPPRTVNTGESDYSIFVDKAALAERERKWQIKKEAIARREAAENEARMVKQFDEAEERKARKRFEKREASYYEPFVDRRAEVAQEEEGFWQRRLDELAEVGRSNREAGQKGDPSAEVAQEEEGFWQRRLDELAETERRDREAGQKGDADD